MSTPRRLGIFGGSFDPVHSGHLELAETARRELQLDKVLFVPARQPPHKKERTLTAAKDRLAMLGLALKPFPFFAISRFEIKRKTTTYTYQTLQYFRRRFPKAALYFIIGTDSLAELSTWKKAELLPALCTFAVGKRPGAPSKKAAAGSSVHILSKPIRKISSSEIRERIEDGQPLLNLVPQAVERYIRRKGLYR